jgi:hypothetical protein
MRYFFVSGFLGGKPFDVALRSENGFLQRGAVVEFVKEKTGFSGTVSILNIHELSAVDYDSWELPYTKNSIGSTCA